MLIHYAILFLFLLTAVADTLAGEVFRFRRIDVDNGLPQSFVNVIKQDSAGFLWVGTQDGLVRYDGQNMKVFALGNVHTLTFSGRTLHANTGRGWFTFDPSRVMFKRSELPIDSAQPEIVSRAIDRMGRVWTAMRHHGVYVTEPLSGKILRFSSASKQGMRLPTNEITGFTFDQRGRAWIGTNGCGVVVVDNMQVDTVLRNSQTDPESLSNDVISSLFCDRDGIVWIGTYGSGMCLWDPEAHHIPSYRIGTSVRDAQLGFVRSITADEQGRTFVGTRTGVVVLSNAYKHQQVIARWPLGNAGKGEVHALRHDRYGRLWIGTDRGGLGYITTQGVISWVPLRDQHANLIRSVYAITPLTDSTISISGPDAVIELHTRTLRSRAFSIPRMQRNVVNVVRCIASIGRGRYLLGTEQGLFVGAFDTQWNFLICKDRNALNPNVNIIRSIAVRNDTAFIGTWGGGIRVVSIHSFNEHVIDTRHGLPNTTVYCVVPRSDGTLTAATNAGIVVLSNGRVLRQITRDQGAQSNEFNTGAWHVNHKGELLAGGIDGLSIIPAELHSSGHVVRSAYLAAIDIDGIQLPDSSVARISKLEIPRETNSFSISVIPILASRAYPLKYRYALRDGAVDTSKWTVTTTSVLRFASVVPGEYNLVVEVQRGGGPWVRAYSLPLEIMPPWWQTWWAVMMFAGSGLSVVIISTAGITRRREARKVEREQLLSEERLRIARDLHDEVGSGLARIVVLADSTSGDSIDGTSVKIADTARAVMASVRSIAWVIKSGEDTLGNTIEYIRDKAEEFFADQNIELVCRIDTPLPLLTLNVLQRRNLILSVQEACANVTKHSHASAVEILCSCDGSSTVLTIRDNGVGLPKPLPHHTSGINNMRTRMHEVGFGFEILSIAGQGTEIRFILS